MPCGSPSPDGPTLTPHNNDENALLAANYPRHRDPNRSADWHSRAVGIVTAPPSRRAHPEFSKKTVATAFPP